MAGAIRISTKPHVAWSFATRAFDGVMYPLKELLEARDPPLPEGALDFRGLDGPSHFSLAEADAKTFRIVSETAEFLFQRYKREGSSSFSSQHRYESFLKAFEELLEMFRADPRMASGEAEG